MDDCDEPDSEVRGTAVWIVEDDISVRESLTILLESLGFAVTVFASGRNFLTDARRSQASLVILDQHMPEMDGLTIIEAMRRDGDSIPVILITGRLDVQIAARAAALGTIAILEKPFSATNLFQLLHGCLEPSP